MRKLLTLIIALLFAHLCSPAQLLQKILPNNGFSTSLAKVVENYETNYLYIQGEALPLDIRDIFLSSLSIPGASRCVIYRFHSTEDTTASWQALLYTGEDFTEASNVYKNTFKQMKQTKFKLTTQEERIHILKLLNNGVQMSVIANSFNISKSTVSRIR